MSSQLRFPLSIRINDGTTDRFVTSQASGLRWRNSAPGGFTEMSVTLNIDPSLFPDLGAADRIWVYGPTGKTLFEGSLDNPGKSADRGGVGLDLTAMGTVVLASDRTQPLVYIDRSLDNWNESQSRTDAGLVAAPSSSASSTTDPSAVDAGSTVEGLQLQFNPGQPLAAQSSVRMNYEALRTGGMTVGAITLRIKSGVTDANYRNDLSYGPAVGAVGNIAGINGLTISTNPSGPHVYTAGGGTLPTGQQRLMLQLRRSGAATNVATDTVWSFYYDIAVLGHRFGANGSLVSAATMGANTSYVRADQVVTDLLSRCMPGLIDLTASTIEAATYQVDQLSYPDGATAADVMDDLSLYEPDMLWEILGSTSNGYVFNYRAWPTTVRYEVSTRDGYEAPGADFDLCNRIAVNYTDTKGVDRTLTVYAASSSTAMVRSFAIGAVSSVFAPALSALEQTGRIRDAEAISLPDGRGSAANAQRVGEQTLAAKANPPKAATVTIRRPIVDLLRGGIAMPYELEPGYLCRVRETGDVLRVTEVEVDDEAGTAVLTLGEPVLENEQRIARLENVTRRSA